MSQVKWKREYWDNGQKEYEVPFVNGQRHGIATWWWDNGKKKYEVPYVNGQQHGVGTWWWGNGKKRREIPWVNDQRHGVETGWWSDGSLWGVTNWDKGEMLVRFVFPEGEVPQEARVEVDLMTNQYCQI
jgi:antitoxin component YwqK of YwqJK toxin-antitoxin module